MKNIDAVYALLEASDPVLDAEALDSSALAARLEAELRYTSGATSQTAGDIPSGRPVPQRARMQRQRWSPRPAWAAAAAFVATVVVLGGSLALGVAMHQPGLDTGSASIPETVGEAAATTSGWWLLIPAIAMAVAIVAALIVRNQQGSARKERVMTSTIETSPADRLETAERNNRWLVATVLMLAIALVALGAWVIYDQASGPDTAAIDEINALYDDYTGTYTDADTGAFLDLTTENYRFRSSGVERTQSEQASILGLGALQVERVGDLVVMGDGPYYFTAAEQITSGGEEYVGVSAYRVIETGDGLKIAEHTWVGNL